MKDRHEMLTVLRHFVAIVVVCFRCTHRCESNEGLWYGFRDAPTIGPDQLSKMVKYHGTNYLGGFGHYFHGCCIATNDVNDEFKLEWRELIASQEWNGDLFVLAEFSRGSQVMRFRSGHWEAVSPRFGPPVFGRGPETMLVKNGKVIVGGYEPGEIGSLACIDVGEGVWEYLGGYMPVIENSNESTYVLAITDSDRGMIVGGRFDKMAKGEWPSAYAVDLSGVVEANNIAIWDGLSWRALGGGVEGSVNCIVSSGTNVYVGGEFKRAGGVDCGNVALWNGIQWSKLGAKGMDGRVSGMAFVNGQVVATGDFTNADGINVNGIAYLEGGGWRGFGDGLRRRDGSAGRGKDLVVLDGGFGVYGQFEQIDGVNVAFGKTSSNWALWRNGLEDRVRMEWKDGGFIVVLLPDSCPYIVEHSVSIGADPWQSVPTEGGGSVFKVVFPNEQRSGFIRVRRR